MVDDTCRYEGEDTTRLIGECVLADEWRQ